MLCYVFSVDFKLRVDFSGLTIKALGCIKLLVLGLTLFFFYYFFLGGGAGDPNYFVHISFSWVEITLHTEFQLPRLP